MTLHARQVAIAAGATGETIERVAAQMVAEKVVRIGSSGSDYEEIWKVEIEIGQVFRSLGW